MSDPTVNENPKKTIRSVETTLRILDVIRRKGRARVTEISDELGITPGAVSHHLNTLRQNDYVVKDDHEYRLGIRFLALGGEARQHEEIYQLSKEKINHLSSETGETVRLIVEQDGYGITIFQSTGENVESQITHLGTLEHLHSTAAGKAFLAYLPSEHVEAIVERRGLKRYTENTITAREELFEELSRIRARGIAFDTEEQFDGVHCIAAPIVDRDEKPLGAVSISAPAGRMDADGFSDTVADLLRNTTGVIQVTTQYSEWM